VGKKNEKKRAPEWGHLKEDLQKKKNKKKTPRNKLAGEEELKGPKIDNEGKGDSKKIPGSG